ncbi:unnamed protein product [Cuscuta epithymum]|uniref:SAWADEE domain-containing protein n=1 Tax=Cuscuta epithymum TaxID=186058 RepID=A0AAV0C711_9ASTE|nr:unnamed protein product [Cuscuta epithymum]CAH9132269.1 unnamed protein product [Cuscuta epithymum]
MESMFKSKGEKTFDQEICEELAAKFSSSPYRSGKSLISWEQVKTWFHNKKQDGLMKKDTLLSLIDKTCVTPHSVIRPKKTVSSVRKLASQYASEKYEKPIGERAAELSDLAFEALSAKDLAWYDVATFLNYRVTHSGELEVRVRFAGFRNDQDEWVSIRKGVRERSIPLAPSECEKVEPGDLVLCFRENEDYGYALYCDAHIVEIERNPHDITACTCIFVVRYDFDNFEDKVESNKICCRPAK